MLHATKSSTDTGSKAACAVAIWVNEEVTHQRDSLETLLAIIMILLSYSYCVVDEGCGTIH